MNNYTELVKLLRAGYVARAKRWSGDTHSGIEGGEVDVEATDKLMNESATAIETLVAKVAELEEYKLPSNVLATVARIKAERDALQAKVAGLEQMKPSMPTSSSVNLII